MVPVRYDLKLETMVPVWFLRLPFHLIQVFFSKKLEVLVFVDLNFSMLMTFPFLRKVPDEQILAENISMVQLFFNSFQAYQ